MNSPKVDNHFCESNFESYDCKADAAPRDHGHHEKLWWKYRSVMRGDGARLVSNPAICYCLSYEAKATFPHGYNKWSAMREMDENYQYS